MFKVRACDRQKAEGKLTHSNVMRTCMRGNTVHIGMHIYKIQGVNKVKTNI